MKIYKDNVANDKYRIYNAETKEEILDWSWFDDSKNCYGICSYGLNNSKYEKIFRTKIEINEQNTENFVYFISSYYRPARREIEKIKKEMGEKVIYYSFAGDKCHVKIKIDNIITNYIGLCSSDTNLDFIKNEIRENPTSFAVIKNEKVIL